MTPDAIEDRAIIERLKRRLGIDSAAQVVRLALNRTQVDELNPPPNPAKVTDSRFTAYAAEHGDESWELDALDPTYIRNLIRDAVLRVRDEKLWQASLEVEKAEREVLVEFAEQLSERDGAQEDEE